MNKKLKNYLAVSLLSLTFGIVGGVTVTNIFCGWEKRSDEVSAEIVVKPSLKEMLPETELIFPGRDLFEINDEPNKYKITVFGTNVMECDAYIERAISLGFDDITFDIESGAELRFRAKSGEGVILLRYDKETENAYVQASNWGDIYEK